MNSHMAHVCVEMQEILGEMIFDKNKAFITQCHLIPWEWYGLFTTRTLSLKSSGFISSLCYVVKTRR